jgi:hypothetical protein
MYVMKEGIFKAMYGIISFVLKRILKKAICSYE